ncbi:MAG TPA: GNAT family N-acetyltransferase [Fimbriimonas sp.]|nr:GNAT family N-acetyltransferase [Fimbriimonas sp.]
MRSDIDMVTKKLDIIRVTTVAEMEEALSVRRRVFIEEQRVPEPLEIDEHDADPANNATCRHVLARCDGVAVGTGRLLLAKDENGQVHIGRVAVLADQRRYGIGRAVMEALHDLAREQGFDSITLAAQTHAIGFYERLGYVLRPGEVFLDAGIEHRWMDLRLGGDTAP